MRPASSMIGTNWSGGIGPRRSEEHTSELQSLRHLVCRLLLEKKKKKTNRKGNERKKKQKETRRSRTRNTGDKDNNNNDQDDNNLRKQCGHRGQRDHRNTRSDS